MLLNKILIFLIRFFFCTAIHCTSSGSTGTSVQTHSNSKPEPELGGKLKNPIATANKPVLEKVTPRTRARRQGLSRNRAVVH